MAFFTCRLHHIDIPVELRARYIIPGRYSARAIDYHTHKAGGSAEKGISLNIPYTKKELIHSYPHLNLDLPWVVEFCCGTGEFIIQLAQNFPEYLFIGVELALPCIERAIQQIKNLPNTISTNLNNLIFYHGDGNDFIAQDFKKFSFEKIMINFPDPWPKKRHLKRRIVSPTFIRHCKSRLKKGGKLFSATDMPDLFHYHDEIISQELDKISTYTKELNPSKNTTITTNIESIPSPFYRFGSRYQSKNLSQSQTVFYTHHRKL